VGEATSRPNVLFLIMHDIGRRYGCYGNVQACSPHIDELAGRSVLFTSHFSQAPLCGPSRANIFSGCRPLTTGRFDNQPFFPRFRERAGPEFRSLPELFREQGYVTCGLGVVYHDVADPPSWNEPYSEPAALPQGPAWLDLAQAGSPNPWRDPGSWELIRQRRELLLRQGVSEEQLRRPEVLRKMRGPAVEAAEVGDDAYFDGAATTQALAWLDRREPGRSFFLAVGFTAGHLPFNVPRRYWSLYDRGSLRLPSFAEPPAGSPEWVMGDSEPAQYYTMAGYEEPWRADRQQSLELLHGHLAAISYIDTQVGRILRALRKQGSLERTIVILTSDHGFHDGEHGYWSKHNLWDHSLRVPLLIRVAGGAHHGGSRVEALSEHVDLYPTLCDLCGLDKPAFLEGDSLLPLLENPHAPGKGAVFAHRRPMWHDRLQVYDIAHSIRTRQHRFTCYLDKAGQVLYRELFDYAADPEERRNHAREESFAQVQSQLEQQLLAGWRPFRPNRAKEPQGA
jgi:iduronate 2-sulfatase